MMTTPTIEQIRGLAERRRAEDALIKQLPELERQARDEAQMETAAYEADVLAARFDTQAGGYQAKRDEMRGRLTTLFAELDKAEADLRILDTEEQSLYDLANRLADRRAHAGAYNALARMHGIKLDKDLVQGQAEAMIKQKLGKSGIYQRTGRESRLANMVLDALSTLIYNGHAAL